MIDEMSYPMGEDAQSVDESKNILKCLFFGDVSFPVVVLKEKQSISKWQMPFILYRNFSVQIKIIVTRFVPRL